jgi:hypothetical protein
MSEVFGGTRRCKFFRRRVKGFLEGAEAKGTALDIDLLRRIIEVQLLRSGFSFESLCSMEDATVVGYYVILEEVQKFENKQMEKKR